MGRYTRKVVKTKNKQHRKAQKGRGVTRALDQIVLEDMLPVNTQKLMNQEIDEDLPGLGQHYCLHCARYFITDKAIQEHFKTKEHKKRVKTTKEEPFTYKESLRAVGIQS